MHEPTIAFSSEAVCKAIARRDLSKMKGSSQDNAALFGQNLLSPFIVAIANHGRVPRGKLAGMLRAMVTKIRHDPRVINLSFSSPRSKLVSNERHRLSYMIATADDDDWVNFVCTDNLLTRKAIYTSTNDALFRIHRHAFTRYMQRESKPTAQLLQDLSDMLCTGALLAITIGTTSSSQDIAVAVGDGMLFGRVTFAPSLIRHSMTITNRVERHYGPVKEPTLQGHPVVEIMTYIDHASMGPVRLALHDKMREYLDSHLPAMKQAFNLAFYDCGAMDGDDDPTPEDDLAMERAGQAARALLKSPEWKAFMARSG